MKSRAEQIKDAAKEKLDEWNEVTGFVVPNTSYYFEVLSLMEDTAEFADSTNNYKEERELNEHLNDKLSQAHAALALAREALEFYADRGNWDDDQFCPTVWDDGSIDLGNKAKEALSKISEVLK